MTEHHPLYHACHGTTGPTGHSPNSPLVQHYADGTMSCDTLLLLPILQLPQAQGNTCLHHVYLSDSTLSVCNAATIAQPCGGCGISMCKKHQSPHLLSVMDAPGKSHRSLLCTTCACLPLQIVLALREFRRKINEQGRVDL
jgi:hypothetical protein